MSNIVCHWCIKDSYVPSVPSYISVYVCNYHLIEFIMKNFNEMTIRARRIPSYRHSYLVEVEKRIFHE